MNGTLNINNHMQGNGTYAQLLMENITSQKVNALGCIFSFPGLILLSKKALRFMHDDARKVTHDEPYWKSVLFL